MTMREKIARAIARVHHLDGDIDSLAKRWCPHGITHATTPVWQDYLAEADAALAAIQEPTKAMEDAAQFRPLKQEYEGGPPRRSLYHEVWVAMAQAAQRDN